MRARENAVFALHPEAEVNYNIEIEQEEDGRWMAEVRDLPGVMTYGANPEDAKCKVQALALRVLAERLENGEAGRRWISS